MKRLIFILLFFCALKIYAQGIGGEIKHSGNTYKSTMTSVIRQKIVYKQMKGKELNQTPIEDDSYSVELEKKPNVVMPLLNMPWQKYIASEMVLRQMTICQNIIFLNQQNKDMLQLSIV